MTTRACSECGTPLSFWRRLTGKRLCKACQARLRRKEQETRDKEEAERQAARTEYEQVLGRLSAGATDSSIVPVLQGASARAGFEPSELAKMNMNAFTSYVLHVLADDLLSEEEEGKLDALGAVLGIEAQWVRESPELGYRLVIASANAGRLPVLPTSSLICRKGEVVHLELAAELMKEVTLREFRGGYSGFSFPIGKTGIRYRVGGARGKSVVTGTTLQVADSGLLAISSKRAVFMGSRKTSEMPYTKLLNLTVYSDGVQFHLSNRQTAPLFRVENGEVVAAVVNAAVHKALAQ